MAAVSREGEVVYDRAFGFQDAKLKEKLRQGGLAKSQEFDISMMRDDLIAFAGKFL